jgi:hypothetical protein
MRGPVTTAAWIAALTCAAAVALAWAMGPLRWLSGLTSAVSIFVLIPWVMSTCIGAVCLVAAAFVVATSAVALPWRRSGAGSLLRELAALPCHIVPGYYRALGRVRSPRVWGFAAGIVAAAVVLAICVINGWAPPA